MGIDDAVGAIEAAWPAPRRTWLGEAPPRDVPPALDGALSALVASGVPEIGRVLVGLAWRSDGELRDRLLGALAAMLDELPAHRWVRTDEQMRPLGSYTWTSAGHGVIASRGLHAFWEAKSLAELRSRLGDRAVVTVLGAMHPRGRIREPAVGALAGDIRGLPVTLLRANDWAEPVRARALESLRIAITPSYATEWLRMLPLALRLDACGRAAHDALIDRVASVFAGDRERGLLIDAVRGCDTRLARAAGALAWRSFAADREVVAALIACPDPLIRLRAVDDSTAALDDDLLAVALRDRLGGVRGRALDVLRRRGRPAAGAALRAACLDRSRPVRDYAAHFLAKSGELDVAAISAEARRRIAAGGRDAVGAIGFLFDRDVATPVELPRFAEHPLGRVRAAAKRRLARSGMTVGGPGDRAASDPSPKVMRALLPVLRECAIDPDFTFAVDRFRSGAGRADARSWLALAAEIDLWRALPELVRAMDDPRPAIAEFARSRIDVTVQRTFRTYVAPAESDLEALAAAIRASRDPRAAAVARWVAAVTARPGWPAA